MVGMLGSIENEWCLNSQTRDQLPKESSEGLRERVVLDPLLFRLFSRTLSEFKCSRSSVVRFLPWRRALFRSTLSIELEDVDRYGW